VISPPPFHSHHVFPAAESLQPANHCAHGVTKLAVKVCVFMDDKTYWPAVDDSDREINKRSGINACRGKLCMEIDGVFIRRKSA